MGKKKIMVIDDNEDFLRLTKLNLEDTGKYEVLALSNVGELISMLNVFRPDVILLDLIMRVGGIEVYERLAKDPLGKTVPIIVISALDEGVDKIKINRPGIVDSLVKPIEHKELVDKIEKVLEERQA